MSALLKDSNETLLKFLGEPFSGKDRVSLQSDAEFVTAGAQCSHFFLVRNSLGVKTPAI